MPAKKTTAQKKATKKTTKKVEPDKLAGFKDEFKPPPHWDKRVSAAYLRLLGGTQTFAAKGAGVAIRTIRNWENHSSWSRAQSEARDRWLVDLDSASRLTLLQRVRKGTDESAKLALKILERIDPKLAPPKLQAEITGEGGGPILHKVVENLPLADLAALREIIIKGAGLAEEAAKN